MKSEAKSQAELFTRGRQQLPILKTNVPLTISSNEIFEIFASASRKERFQIIEME
jgi:hypothetical protein